MARKRDRIFAGFFAGLFLLTSSALTIGIIAQAVQNRNEEKTTKQSTPKEKTVDNNAKLKGTQLANFTPIADIPDLKTEDTVVGTGAEVKSTDTITVDYTGALASTGVIFESSKDSGQPATFPLDGVITGWTKGIPGMKEGGTRRLFIPSAMAYGPTGQGAIPPDSDLVFDVTLHSISK